MGWQGFGCMGFVSCIGPIASHLLFMFHFFQCETSPELLGPAGAFPLVLASDPYGAACCCWMVRGAPTAVPQPGTHSHSWDVGKWRRWQGSAPSSSCSGLCITIHAGYSALTRQVSCSCCAQPEEVPNGNQSPLLTASTALCTLWGDIWQKQKWRLNLLWKPQCSCKLGLARGFPALAHPILAQEVWLEKAVGSHSDREPHCL